MVSFSVFIPEILPAKNIILEKAVLCSHVAKNEAVGIATDFSPEVGKVYFWTKVSCENIPTKVRHIWYHENTEMAEVTLEIKYPSMRTFSCKKIMPQWTGAWYVEIVDDNNLVLKRLDFTIGSSEEGVKEEQEQKIEKNVDNIPQKVLEENKAETEAIDAAEKESMAALNIAEEIVMDESTAKDIDIEIKLGTGVKEREIIGEARIFPADVGKIYCWNLIAGIQEPTEIKHVWYYNNEKIAETSLKVKYDNYRTWSYKTIMPNWAGDWRVEIVDAKGNLAQKASFKINP